MKWLQLGRSKLKQEPSKAQLLLGYANEADVVALFTLLGLLAKSNGAVTATEIAEVQRFIDCHIPDSLQQLAKDSFRRGKQVNLVRGVISKNAFSLYWNRSVRWLEPCQVLDILLRVAFADGEYSSWEEYIIDCTRATLGVHKRTYWILRDRLAERMDVYIRRDTPSFAGATGWSDLDERGASRRFTEESQHNQANQTKAEERKQKHQGAQMKETPRDPYLVLELQHGAAKDDIKKAYRRLVKVHHPDMLRNGTGSQQDLDAAVQRFCEVQWAYETLMVAS